MRKSDMNTNEPNKEIWGKWLWEKCASFKKEPERCFGKVGQMLQNTFKSFNLNHSASKYLWSPAMCEGPCWILGMQDKKRHFDPSRIHGPSGHRNKYNNDTEHEPVPRQRLVQEVLETERPGWGWVERQSHQCPQRGLAQWGRAMQGRMKGGPW